MSDLIGSFRILVVSGIFLLTNYVVWLTAGTAYRCFKYEKCTPHFAIWLKSNWICRNIILRVRSLRSVFVDWFKTKAIGFLIVLFCLISGCSSVDKKPFEIFNSSLVELNNGVASSLDVVVPLAEKRYRSEVEDELRHGDSFLLQKSMVSVNPDDPFFMPDPPVFMEAKRFKLEIFKVNMVWLKYSGLLLQLSSENLLSEEKFSKLSDDLNKNAFDLVSYLNKSSKKSAENTAFFSELAIAAAKEYLRTKQINKLKEVIARNQESINLYVEQIQKAIILIAHLSGQEYSGQQVLFNELSILVRDNKGSGDSLRMQKLIGEIIDQKIKYSDQIGSLHELYIAYGKIPDAHAELATRLTEPTSSIAALNELMRAGAQLYSSYEGKLKNNKVELIQAKADAASSEAEAAELMYQQVKLKYAQAQFEYVRAQNASDADPGNEAKIKNTDEKNKMAKELKIESDRLKESSENLRVAATAIQESAAEIKKNIMTQ